MDEAHDNSASELKIFDIQRFCLHDGPGIRTTVFFKGCNLHCPWCANPESQSTSCPDGPLPLGGRRASVTEIMETVLKDRDYYQNSGGGLTVSGGEPTLQFSGLCALLQAARAAGIATAIETCGDASEDRFASLEPLVDCFLFDLKHIDAEKLKSTTGGNLLRIRHNLERLAQKSPHKISLRVPLIPGFNLGRVTMNSIYDYALSLGIQKIDLMPYHVLGRNKYAKLGREYPGADIPTPDRGECEQIRDVGIKMGLVVSLG